VRRRRHSAAYKAHLASPEWRAIRKAALVRAGYRCAFCGLSQGQVRRRGRHLEVHHNSYENLGHERPQDLTVLCAGRGGCHAAADRQRRAQVRGRKRKAVRRRRRRGRIAKPFRDLLAVVFVLGAVFIGLHIAALVLGP
jgi:hypothetical protein